MDIFCDVYQRGILENEKKIFIWQKYLMSHKELDLKVFLNKLKVPALIPIGSRILFRGDLIHTNELTLAIGANYFVKCTTHQAEAIKQHRIKGAEEKLQQLKKEHQYLENQLSYSQKKVWDEPGKEIIEPYNENDENVWKLKHRENIRKNKLQEKVKGNNTSNVPDNDIWDMLEQLELKEELENENDITRDNDLEATTKYNYVNINNELIKNPVEELKHHLSEMKTQPISPSAREEIFKRLDQLEEQEALEEELDRLEDDNTVKECINDDGENSIRSSKKSITFASDYVNDCINIYFGHSDCSPVYNKSPGILTPNDIYFAFPKNFQKTPIVTILKDTKHTSYVEDVEIPYVKQHKLISVKVIGDISENSNTEEENKVIKLADRPPSKFKTMRMKKLA